MRCPTARGNFATVQVFLAGGVPEVMLHLRAAGLLDTSVRTVIGERWMHASIGGSRARGGMDCGARSANRMASIPMT